MKRLSQIHDSPRGTTSSMSGYVINFAVDMITTLFILVVDVDLSNSKHFFCCCCLSFFFFSFCLFLRFQESLPSPQDRIKFNTTAHLQGTRLSPGKDYFSNIQSHLELLANPPIQVCIHVTKDLVYTMLHHYNNLLNCFSCLINEPIPVSDVTIGY